jgi:O-6-methylguanine DNA methyltransferase
MIAHGFALFDTAIGRCAIAWSGRGILAVQLPEADERKTRARLIRRFPQAHEAAPPPAVARALEGIAALLRGERIDLSAVALDLDGVSPFHRRVYEVARTIAPGATRSYGEIAARLGAPRSARAVGQALGRNPVPILVRAIACSRPAASPAAFPRTAGLRPSSACSRSKPRRTTARPLRAADRIRKMAATTLFRRGSISLAGRSVGR